MVQHAQIEQSKELTIQKVELSIPNKEDSNAEKVEIQKLEPSKHAAMAAFGSGAKVSQLQQLIKKEVIPEKEESQKKSNLWVTKEPEP